MFKTLSNSFKQSDTARRLIVASVLLSAGAYAVYAAWPKSARIHPTLMCTNQSCSHVWVGSLQVGDSLPLSCPKCAQNSGVPAFKCSGCTAANIWNETRGLPPPTKCRQCGKEARHGG